MAAQTESTRRIDKRQDRQERRIEKGEKSGQLTQKEAARKERARIEKAQDRQSKKIYRERHDKQSAK